MQQYLLTCNHSDHDHNCFKGGEEHVIDDGATEGGNADVLPEHNDATAEGGNTEVQTAADKIQ